MGQSPGLVARQILLASAITVGWHASTALATNWQAGAGTPDDWFDSAAWDSGVPTNSSTANISNGGIADITYGNAAAQSLYLGSTLNGSGTVSMSAGQLSLSTLTLAQATNSTGVFSQSGGFVTTSNLMLNTTGGSSATYDLSGTGTFTSTYEQFGNPSNKSAGTFIQTGGTHDDRGQLQINYGSYSMSGPSSLNTDEIYIGTGATSVASFTQSAGITTVSESFQIGQGSYSISSGGNFSDQSDTYIGYGTNSTASFAQTDSICNFGNNSATYPLFIGWATGSNGSYTLAGNSQLNSTAESLGYGSSSTGNFTQTGGINNLNQGSLYLAYAAGSTSSYAMSGSSSTVYAGSEYIGYAGTGTFTQTGGTNNAGGLFMGNNSAGSATYTLSGGNLITYFESFYTNTSAVFNQTGGVHTILYDQGNGELNLYETATYNLSGGEFNVPTENVGLSTGPAVSLFNQTGGVHIVNTLNISQYGKFTFAGGNLQITKSFANNGIFDMVNPASIGKSGTNSLSLPLAISGTGSIIAEANTFLSIGALTTYQASLNISGEIQLLPAFGTNSQISSLTINPGGTLDITNDQLSVYYTSASPLATIQGYVASGYASGWKSNGIISSLAAGQTAVGVGFEQNSGVVEIRFTWLGDANLDGKVNSVDASMMSASGTTWAQGDFNYDGVVNADDYALYDLGLAVSGGQTVVVPEPSWICAAILPLLGSGLRRRRTRRYAPRTKSIQGNSCWRIE
ncbi:MAG TPA: dockerin type I repeat-containing protein [Tepidisphaeraceae bacterium]|jgi:hypothetical protein